MVEQAAARGILDLAGEIERSTRASTRSRLSCKNCLPTHPLLSTTCLVSGWRPQRSVRSGGRVFGQVCRRR
jgi:hypothetical protein